MPALVSALNRVDLPTLGKPTIPHFMKVLMNQYEPARLNPMSASWKSLPRVNWRGRKGQSQTRQNSAFLPSFVLV
jgi:hypothetical protein